MRNRGARRGSTARRGVRLAALASAALILAGCGSSDFANEPRPPVPLQATAKVDNKQVVVSPDRFGAGLVTFTVANLSNSPVRFSINDQSTGQIDAGAVSSLKVQLDQGSYRASAGDGVEADRVEVGPERKSAQNKLLLP